jgi:hypothetical protein
MFRSDRVIGSWAFMKSLLCASVLIGVAGVGAASPNAPQSLPARAKIDVSKRGPQVGERVPDFNLPDQDGHTQTLQSIMGSKGAMLVFIRSADW